jgi:hypothetical protein
MSPGWRAGQRFKKILIIYKFQSGALRSAAALQPTFPAGSANSPTAFFSSRVENDEAEVFEGQAAEDELGEEEREAVEETWNRREIKDCPDLLQLDNGRCHFSRAAPESRSSKKRRKGSISGKPAWPARGISTHRAGTRIP